MNILVVTLEQSKLLRLDYLDQLTAPTFGAGVNHERYWIINSNVPLSNPTNDYEVTKLMSLLHLVQVHNFNALMIKKNV
jgi:hypothetical protein